jgi:hypothetical protein
VDVKGDGGIGSRENVLITNHAVSVRFLKSRSFWRYGYGADTGKCIFV